VLLLALAVAVMNAPLGLWHCVLALLIDTTYGIFLLILTSYVCLCA